MLVFGVVPLSILLLNIFVILETGRLARVEKVMMRQQHGNKEKPGGTGMSKNTPSATTVMLLAVSFFLIFTTLPVTILYVLFPSFDEGQQDLVGEAKLRDPKWQRHFAYTEVRTVVEEIGMSHYAINFYIYVFTGKIFRRELCCLAARVFSRVDRATGRDMHLSTSSWFNRAEGSFTRVRTGNKEATITDCAGGNISIL